VNEILGIFPIAVANLLRDKRMPGIKKRGVDGIDRWIIRREDVAHIRPDPVSIEVFALHVRP